MSTPMEKRDVLWVYLLHLCTKLCGFHGCTEYTPLRLYHRRYNWQGSDEMLGVCLQQVRVWLHG